MLIPLPLTFGRGLNYKGFSYSDKSFYYHPLRHHEDLKSYSDSVQKFDQAYHFHLYRSFNWPFPKSEEEVRQYLAQIQKADKRYQGLLYQSLGESTGWGFQGRLDLWEKFEKEIPVTNQKDFYRGLASTTSFPYSQTFNKDFEAVLVFIQRINPLYRNYFYKVLGEGLVSFLERGQNPAVIHQIETKGQPFVYQGIGKRLFHLDQKRRQQLIDVIDPKYHASIYEGMGEKIYLFHGEDPVYSAYLIQRLPPSFQNDCRRGYERTRDAFEKRN